MIENLRVFFENQNIREGFASTAGINDDIIAMIRHNHSLRCFPRCDQDATSRRSSPQTQNTKISQSENERPIELVVHFHTPFPSMGVFLPSLLQELARLLFNIDVRVLPQSPSASKILSVVKEHIDRNQELPKIKINGSDPNNNRNAVGAAKALAVIPYRREHSMSDILEHEQTCESQSPDEACVDDYDSDTDSLTTNKTPLLFYRKRRLADSEKNSVSKKENFYKYVIKLNSQLQQSNDVTTDTSSESKDVYEYFLSPRLNGACAKKASMKKQSQWSPRTKTKSSDYPDGLINVNHSQTNVLQSTTNCSDKNLINDLTAGTTACHNAKHLSQNESKPSGKSILIKPGVTSDTTSLNPANHKDIEKKNLLSEANSESDAIKGNMNFEIMISEKLLLDFVFQISTLFLLLR